MLDVSTSMLANQASNFLATNEIPQRLGNQHPNIVPYQAGGLGEHSMRAEPSECTGDDFMIFFHFSIAVHDIKLTLFHFASRQIKTTVFIPNQNQPAIVAIRGDACLRWLLHLGRGQRSYLRALHLCSSEGGQLKLVPRIRSTK